MCGSVRLLTKGDVVVQIIVWSVLVLCVLFLSTRAGGA